MPDFENPHAAFTGRYRRFVAEALDRFEFFGVDPGGIPRRHPFARGYVPLTVEAPDGAPNGRVGVGGRSDRELAEVPRALVRGVAGAGKSTLLRWLAVNAARSDAPRVPFLLELGRIRDGRPPRLETLVAASLQPEMPDGWVHHVLAGGEVLLLLDGLDEVRPREREHVEGWLDELLAAFPDTGTVVSTRPSAVAERRWTDAGFRRFDLLSMSRHSITEYVHGWHEIARADYDSGTPAGANAREWLTQYEQDLLATLSRRPALAGISSNPLLAGLLCAIHLDRGEHLPANRKQVYDAALDLLLVRWPELRRRRRLHAGRGQLAEEPESADPDDIALGVEEQTKLLQRIAVWLVRNREITSTREVALAQVRSSMIGLRGVDASPEQVLRYLAVQTGLLWELADGSLEFVHRTFRDYLAAKELVEEADFTTLIDNADKPLWQDVVVLAGAAARPAERRLLLERLLGRALAEPEHRDTLSLLAAAVLEQSPVLPSGSGDDPDFPGAVRTALSRLVPPRTSAEADELAAVGPIVLDLLPGPEALSTEDAERVVRTLASLAARWNPPGALDKLLAFAARPTPGMLTELLIAWGRSDDYESFAARILSVIDYGGILVQLQNQRRVDHVEHLATITDLKIDHNVGDLRPLVRLPRLRRLTVYNNESTDLRPLAGIGLRRLDLENCRARGSRPVDLTPLRELGLRRLSLSGLRGWYALDGLAGARIRTLTLASRVLDAVEAMPPMSLTHLAVLGRSRPLPRLDAVDGPRTVTLDWVPDVATLRALADHGVRDLLLWRVGPQEPVPAAPNAAGGLRIRRVDPPRRR